MHVFFRCDISPMQSANLLNSNKENVADSISKQLQDFFPFLEKYIKLGERNISKIYKP